MQRFGLPLESCEGDQKRLRKCLVSGYWRNAARFVERDGTFRSVRGETVGIVQGYVEGRLINIAIGAVYPPKFGDVHPETQDWLGYLP